MGISLHTAVVRPLYFVVAALSFAASGCGQTGTEPSSTNVEPAQALGVPSSKPTDASKLVSGTDIQSGDCSPVMNSVTSQAGVSITVICNQKTEKQMIEDLFHSDWRRTCFVAAPKEWRIDIGAPEMSMTVRPEPGTYFAQYDFSMSVRWASRAIDPELFGNENAPLSHVNRPNRESLVCDIENKKHSLTRGGLSYPEPMESFLVDGKVPIHDYTIPLTVYTHYEDGEGEEACEISVFTRGGTRTAEISVDNVVDPYPELDAELPYIVFSCSSDDKLRRASFDRLCSSLIAKVTQEQDFTPGACIDSGHGFIWPRSDPEPTPMPWTTSTIQFSKVLATEAADKCECLDMGGELERGTVYSPPERPKSGNLDADARNCEHDVRLSIAGSDHVFPLANDDALRIAAINVAAGDFRRYRLGDAGIVRVAVLECEQATQAEE